MVHSSEIDIAQFVDKVDQTVTVEPTDCVATALEYMISVKLVSNSFTSPRRTQTSMKSNFRMSTTDTRLPSIIEDEPTIIDEEHIKSNQTIKDLEAKVA